MLEGWLAQGLPPGAFTVLDPKPGPRLIELAAEGLHLNEDPPADPAIAIIAVKPQMMGDALPIMIGPGGVDVATQGELRKKQVPPVLAEVVDSARVRGWR